MQPFKLKELFPCTILALAVSMPASATVENFAVGFTTVPDITLTEVTPMDFGAGLALGSGLACAMTVTNTGVGFAGDVIAKLAGTEANAEEATYGDLDGGAGCLSSSGSKGTPGIYQITGVSGGAVSVTVNNITAGTDFNFVAAGCVGNYDGSGDGDDCTTVTPGSPVSVTLASGGDTVGNTAGAGIPTPGVSLIILGGTLTTASVHAASTVLSETFVVDVTY